MRTKFWFSPLIPIAIFSFILLFSNCTKEDDGSDVIDNPPPPPPVTANVLCDGKTGQNSYFPLAIGNYWEYERPGSGTTGITETTFSVTKTLEIEGKEYFQLDKYFGYPTSETESYYRVDPATNDVYSFYWGENLYMPGNPVVGQVLQTTNGIPRRTVLETNATVSTQSCTYTGCVVIGKYTDTGYLYAQEYFKKGLGMVHNGSTKLKKVTLK